MIKRNYRLGKYEKHECWVSFKNRRRPFSSICIDGALILDPIEMIPAFSRYFEAASVSAMAIQQGISMLTDHRLILGPVNTLICFRTAASFSLTCVPFVPSDQVKQKFTWAPNKEINAEIDRRYCFPGF